jgi:hypothetical protein
MYVFRTNLGTAFGDVTETDSGFLLDQIDAIIGVERMHLQSRQAHKEPWSGKLLLVILVIANDVTDVLA